MISQFRAPYTSTGDSPSSFPVPLASICLTHASLSILRFSDTCSAVISCSTYEGDLLAMAGVKFTVGRESSAQYNESFAGRRPLVPGTCYGA